MYPGLNARGRGADMALHNQHVYLRYRWLGWVAEQQGRLMRAFFMRDFARQELEAQEKHNGA